MCTGTGPKKQPEFILRFRVEPGSFCAQVLSITAAIKEIDENIQTASFGKGFFWA